MEFPIYPGMAPGQRIQPTVPAGYLMLVPDGRHIGTGIGSGFLPSGGAGIHMIDGDGPRIIMAVGHFFPDWVGHGSQVSMIMLFIAIQIIAHITPGGRRSYISSMGLLVSTGHVLGGTL